MTKLRLMSSNIWWCDENRPAWEAKGEDCSAAVRGLGLARLYMETAPDVIGLQECSAAMAHVLMTELSRKGAAYALLWGRDTPILYRRDKFELVDSDMLVYPEQVPGLPGSFNNLQTKSYCIAVLRLKENGKVLVFGNTHLMYRSGDPKSPNYLPHVEEARAWQAARLADRVEALQAQYGGTAVLVGDFNTWPICPAIQNTLKRGYMHGHDAATQYADQTSGLHDCSGEGYNGRIWEGGFAQSIDHIFLRGEVTVQRYERYCPDWFMPLSDHAPLWVDVEL